MVSARRRPRLKVVSHSLGATPRNRVAFVFRGYEVGLEIITEAAWAKLHDAEKPMAILLPGIGYAWLTDLDRAERDEIVEEHADAMEAWAFRRGVTQERF